MGIIKHHITAVVLLPLAVHDFLFVNIGIRAGGGNGAAAPQLGKLCNFSGKTLMIRATALDIRHYKITNEDQDFCFCGGSEMSLL